MTRPHVIVVGGGLAGLAAGLACADAGARVTLLEARSRLGGATWSTRLRGLEVDNGQHVFLRCFSAYRGFLDRIGSGDRVELQRRLAVPVLRPGRPTAWLRRAPLPAPLHLAPSLLRFGPLSLRERIRTLRTVRRIGGLRLEDPALDEVRLGDWLRERGESGSSIERFYDLLIRPTLNIGAEEASLALAAKVYQTGLLERADAADIGWTRVPFERAHAAPAAAALDEAGVRVHLRAPVDRIEGGEAVWTGGTRLSADAVVLAADHEAAAGLLPAGSGIAADDLRELGRAPIVNLHLLLDRRVTRHPLLAAVDSPLQWVFDRSAAAGLSRGQYLVVSLSAADAYLGMSRESLRAQFWPALQALLPGARDARLEDLFVTCERAATFRQTAGTQRLRPASGTRIPGLAVAGAWTDTRWPATMEGAVRSGRAAAREALRAAGVRVGLPALAA